MLSVWHFETSPHVHGSDQKHESIHVWPLGSYVIADECCSDTEQSAEGKTEVGFSSGVNISLTSHHLQHLETL